MAQKIKLGARPKSFARTITFAMVEGGEGSMELVYRYRSRKELAKLTDEVQAAAQAQHDADMAALKAKAEKGETIEPLKQIDLLDRDVSLQVDYLMQVVEGWNLDEKFDRAAVEQLADEVPAAISVAIETYRKAINEGRLGN
jgi:coenzyme F420-reducing hydrogenase alpha subunit